MAFWVTLPQCVDSKLKSFLPQVHSLLNESNCAFYFHERKGENTFVKFHCTYWGNRKPYKFSHWLVLDVGSVLLVQELCASIASRVIFLPVITDLGPYTSSAESFFETVESTADWISLNSPYGPLHNNKPCSHICDLTSFNFQIVSLPSCSILKNVSFAPKWIPCFPAIMVHLAKFFKKYESCPSKLFIYCIETLQLVISNQLA